MIPSEVIPFEIQEQTFTKKSGTHTASVAFLAASNESESCLILLKKEYYDHLKQKYGSYTFTRIKNEYTIFSEHKKFFKYIHIMTEWRHRK